MVKSRESNIELLRIIAMMMITMHHYLLMRYLGGIVGGNEFVDGWQWAVLLNGFVYIGVNVFVLISGYFGIKFKWKGVLNILVYCCFYMAVNLLWATYVSHTETYDIGVIVAKTLKATTRTTKWFIPCYLALYFLSPLLNSARENLSKRQYLFGLIVLSIYCLWFGFIRQVHVFNHNGYTVGQFIWLYFIGGYIRRFQPQNKLPHKRTVLLGTYLLSCLIWAGLTIAQYSGVNILIWHPTTYNNPFTLLGAIAFFCLFTTFEFQSKWVNYIAQSMLAVYLCGLPFFKIGDLVEQTIGVWHYIGLGFVWVLCRLLVGVSVDQIRLALMVPINKLWDVVSLKVPMRFLNKR